MRVGTSERGSRCAFVVGCRKRLPRWGGWADDSSPRPLASLGIPAARRTGMRLIEIKLRLPRWPAEGDGPARISAHSCVCISVIDRGRCLQLLRWRLGETLQP